MRIAGFVLGLILSLIVLGASFFSFFISSLGKIAGKEMAAESLQTAGAAAFLLAILGIIGAALVLRYRIAPTILLFLVAFGLILVGTFTLYKDMAVFGGLFILPAIFAGISRRKKRM